MNTQSSKMDDNSGNPPVDEDAFAFSLDFSIEVLLKISGNKQNDIIRDIVEINIIVST